MKTLNINEMLVISGGYQPATLVVDSVAKGAFLGAIVGLFAGPVATCATSGAIIYGGFALAYTAAREIDEYFYPTATPTA